MSKVQTRQTRQAMQVLLVLLISSGVSAGLFLIRVIATDDFNYWYMIWNLFLAWIPVLFIFLLRYRLPISRWLTWPNILLTLLWLVFLPNSFYMVSDYIHLQNTGEVLKLYDVAMMTSFVANGLILGYITVYIMHHELLKRMKARWAHTIIGLVLLSCGFAIYLGRYLRWNTWDVLLNPMALIFDISERIIHPAIHSETFIITATFFVLIASIYAVGYQLAHLFQGNNQA